MANIECRSDTTYRIVISAGYATNGKKLRKYKTITLPNSMTERQREKELNRQATLFEEQVRTGKTYIIITPETQRNVELLVLNDIISELRRELTKGG